MPAIPSPVSLLNHSLAQRRDLSLTEPTSGALQVVCAWPVSGQYGPGTRILYYVLIAACVFARKTAWIRNACLAAVLIFPSVAALHGIVLAAIHVPGAVDMDLYGAFQFCTIGILTAPATVRLSRTYFNDPGRDIIFLWTGLLLAGLLSLTVGFFRIKPSPCPHDDDGNPVDPNPGRFGYDTHCGLVCSEGEGPFSPLRGGSANDIYVIPTPDGLTFNTATLLAAACCIPAILSLVSMWIKILDDNWIRRFGGKREKEKIDEPIEGTNGATVKKMNGINALIGKWLTLVEIPVFGAAVLAILIIGEINFWSSQVMYQTEPIASIGQWAPIVGAGLAVLGSLYMLLAADMEAEVKQTKPTENPTTNQCAGDLIPANTTATAELRRSSVDIGDIPSTELEITASQFSLDPTPGTPSNLSEPADMGARRKVAHWLTTASDYLTTAAHDQFEDSGFADGERSTWPEIPAELYRNRNLFEIKELFRSSPAPRSQSSRPGSFSGSMDSVFNGENGSMTPRTASRQSSLPVPSPSRPRRLHSNSSPGRISSFASHFPVIASTAGSSADWPLQWGEGSRAPASDPRSSTSTPSSPASISDSGTIPGISIVQSPPRIVVSSESTAAFSVQPSPVGSPTILPAADPPSLHFNPSGS